MAGKRKKYSAEFKGKVALDAIRGGAKIAELVIKHGVHQAAINTWKRQALASRDVLLTKAVISHGVAGGIFWR